MTANSEEILYYYNEGLIDRLRHSRDKKYNRYNKYLGMNLLHYVAFLYAYNQDQIDKLQTNDTKRIINHISICFGNVDPNWRK